MTIFQSTSQSYKKAPSNKQLVADAATDGLTMAVTVLTYSAAVTAGMAVINGAIDGVKKLGTKKSSKQEGGEGNV